MLKSNVINYNWSITDWNFLNSDTSMKWQYVASTEGEFNNFPSTPDYYTSDDGSCRIASTCPGYNPKSRPWYRAAVSGPKRIVILLDNAGSMQKGDRFNQAKSFITSLLAQFDHNDKVAIISVCILYLIQSVLTVYLIDELESNNCLWQFNECDE
jgi:uncharacterized protein with von Willebrand factor type A (vWA) domain